MSVEIQSKEDVSIESVAALAAEVGLNVAPDRMDEIAQRLHELFDLAAPLEGSTYDEYEVTKPFDPRWTNEAKA